MRRLLVIIAALAVLLAACQAIPIVVTVEPEDSEYTHVAEEYESEPVDEPLPPEPSPAPPPEPEPTPPPPTGEDYIAMLETLQDAFASGD